MRNVVSPIISMKMETEPQGEAMVFEPVKTTGKRVWDLGKSECCAVMVQIGVQNLP